MVIGLAWPEAGRQSRELSASCKISDKNPRCQRKEHKECEESEIHLRLRFLNLSWEMVRAAQVA